VDVHDIVGRGTDYRSIDGGCEIGNRPLHVWLMLDLSMSLQHKLEAGLGVDEF
jgi:hypothetical protein